MFCSYLGQTKGSISELCNWNQELYENTLAKYARARIYAQSSLCNYIVKIVGNSCSEFVPIFNIGALFIFDENVQMS